MRRKLRKPLAILLAFAMVFCVAPNIGFAADNDANSVERVSGHDRYETAANIAEYAFPNGADAVVIANGEPALGYADALAGSFLAGAAEAPILLTQANVLPDATAEAIETLNATRAYVLGGELAVSDAVYSELEALGLEVERVWGQNRYATAVKVYETGAELVGTVNTALIANATRPSDALAAGAYANEANVPVLLVDQDSIHPATEAALAGIENTFVIGGNLVVSDEVVSELDATRVSGRTRNATSVAVAETLWESPENFVLVNGADGIVDALAGSVLGMPILYVPSDDVDAYLDKVITANSRGLILGGVNRISDEFLNEIQQKIEGVEEELQVVSVSAINANTILVTFEGMEPVEITLETPLVHGQTEVTFVYEEVEYTGILDEAYADPEVVEEEIAEAVDAAIAKINAIDNPATLTLEDEAKVVAARTAVDAAIELGAVDADIVNLDHLIAAEAKIKSLKDELDAKETAIQDANVALTNLPLAANITLEDKEQVEAARVLVDEAFNLGAEESDLINLWKLTDAEAKIAELEGEATDAEAVQAVEDAIAALPVEAELTLADKDAVVAARAAYDALTEAQQALVPNVNVLEAAEAKITALEEAAAKEITVKSVSAIETTFVEVTFDALTEALTDVTVEVKDSTGAVVAVVAQDLAVGATSAQFDFVKAVTADDLTGVWTVDGVAFSFDELELVADIVAEAGAAVVNQVRLLALLNEAGIQNLNADRIATYANAIDTATTPVWAKDIQKIIDDANKDAAEAADEAAVVKTVVDATNQIQLLSALEANFERVNADWIADYAEEVVVGATKMLDLAGPANYFANPATATSVDMDMIQTAIDTANGNAITTADGAADTSAKQAAVTVLIQNWVEADDPETPLVTPKADAIKASQIKEAAFRIAEATTENSLYNALVAYANITPDTTLKASELNANLKAFYKGALDAKTKAALVGEIQAGTEDIKADFVTAVDAAALEDVVVDLGAAATALAGTDNATNKAAFKAELVRLANYTSHKSTATTKFLMSTIDEALLVEYATQMDSDGIGTGKVVADVQASVTTVNDGAAIAGALKIVNDKDATLAEVREALIDIAIEVADGATDEAFLNSSKQAQLEIAELVKKARPAGATGYADLDAIIDPADGTGALDDAMTIHAAELAKFNAIGDLDGATPTNTKAALDTYAYKPYAALTNAEKLAVATEINSLTKVVADVVTPLDFSGADAVETLAEANAIIDAAIAAIK